MRGHNDKQGSSAHELPFIVIGNPENRRVSLFQEALARQGQPSARVLSWLELSRVGTDNVEEVFAQLPKAPALVRIDSFGEDFEVERQLLHHGFEDAVEQGVWAVPPAEIAALAYDRGIIFAPKQQHLGFVRVLRKVERALASRPHLHVLNAPASIERLFDKRTCAVTFANVGVPIPRPLLGITSAAELRHQMEASNIARVFVKLSCGSSASCLALFEHAKGGEWLFTSMEIEGDRLYNSLRPRRYRDQPAIDRLLTFLFREGSHVEEHVAKARLEGKFFDTRMLTVRSVAPEGRGLAAAKEGEVAFTVVRKSQHPVTNLHLGGTRGTTSELEELIPEQVLRDAHESCRKVFAAHDCLHIGIDVMFTARLDGHRILEANAFGDLLPNLERDGLSVYEWEIRAALANSRK